MFNKKVRQSIRDDWEKLKIYPLTDIPDIDPTKYRYNHEGRVVKGEYFGEKGGITLSGGEPLLQPFHHRCYTFCIYSRPRFRSVLFL